MKYVIHLCLLLVMAILLSVVAGLYAGDPPDDPDARILALVKDTDTVSTGGKLFQANCAACHSTAIPEGVPTNLRDGKWFHGAKPTEIMATITNGVPEKRMPPWKTVLRQEQIKALTVYILSLQPSGPAPDNNNSNPGVPSN